MASGILSRSAAVGVQSQGGHRLAGVRAASRRPGNWARRHDRPARRRGTVRRSLRPDRGELGTNGTPEIRRARGRRGRRVLGAAWRENLGWPDGGIDRLAGADRDRPSVSSAAPAAHDRHPVLAGPASRSRRGEPRARRRGVSERPAPLRHRRRSRGGRTGSATTSSTTRRRRRSSSTSRRTTRSSARALACYREPVRTRGRRRGGDAADGARRSGS